MRRFFLYIFIIASIVFSNVALALATSDSATLNVGLVKPAVVGGGGGNGGGGGGGTTNNAPTIGAVNIVLSSNSATLGFTATDDVGVAGVTVVYGTTNAYGSSATVGGTYNASINGLAAGTQYFYLITVTDGAGLSATSAGNFTTLPSGAAFTISGVNITPGTTDATVVWQTSAQADSQVLYGKTNSFGSTASNNALVTDHSLTLLNLLPNTKYFIKITGTDSLGNQIEASAEFTTLPDNISPPDVQDFRGMASGAGIDLSWTNPDPVLFPDVQRIVIVRKVGSAPPANPGDGTQVYSALGTSFTDQNVSAGVVYSYSAFTYDTSLNHSNGSSVTGIKITVTPALEICANGIDDNANGLIDCADSVCASDPTCSVISGGTNEICDNGIDDNANGLIDCADSACGGFSGCTSLSNAPVLNLPIGSVGSNVKIGLDRLKFLAGSRKIALLIRNGSLHSLAGTQLSVAIPADVLIKNPESITLVLNGFEKHLFAYASADKNYYTDIVMPSLGEHSAYVEVMYSASEIDVIAFKISSQAWGDITDSGKRVQGAQVELLDGNGRHVPMEEYGQSNPFETGVNGNYGFLVPNGNYQIKIVATGYEDRLSPIFTVVDNFINFSYELIAKPLPLLDKLDPNKSITENVSQLADNVVGRTKIVGKQISQAISDARKDVEVQKTVGDVVVPTVVGASAISFLSFISFSNLLPLLRLLFLQPLLLLGRKKREGWGQVYNALTKLPVDLATIRLINAETGAVVQTKVTDAKGRYAFVAQPGKYRIEAQKGNMQFPSDLLKGFKDDGRKTDIYHGEVVEVTDKDAVITVNVPLDPLGDASVPVRLHLQRISRFLKSSLSILGLIITIFSFYITPKWYVGALLVAHFVLVYLFRRLAIPPKIKSWGIVYENNTKQPVGRAIARLFNSQFNKLVSTQITDAKGRYYFLAGDNKYYVTYEHPEYENLKTEDVDLSGKEAEAIAMDVGLKKK